jgi:1-aminocyclopropane-1-carboxylate deaminase/D-cysteine desulfhydrase-like pyridoxal-dependent ACC family enzyme
MQDDSFDIPLQRISDEITVAAGVELFVLRIDLNHPFVSGNKRFKLKYNLENARNQDKKTILTFGGAFSNHIAATAAACNEQGFMSIGIIRGDQSEDLNPTLKFAKEQGMELYFVSREIYRLKNEVDFFMKSSFSHSLIDKFTNSFFIPEGGANDLGVEGCKEIRDHIDIPFDTICCPCGTGTTIAGIILSLKGEEKALGFQVLKGENYIRNEVKRLLDRFRYDNDSWSINEDFHFGGYAKYDNELLDFMKKFKLGHNIELDFVYTGKMMFGIYNLMKKGYFPGGERVIVVHTGGLQGNPGLLLR